jgi:protein TonB
VITFGVYVTAQAREVPIVETPENPPIYVKARAKTPPKTSHQRSRPDQLPWKEHETIVPLIDIPDHLPPIDTTRGITNDDLFRDTGATRGESDSIDDAAHTDGDHPCFEFQVEKPALARDGNPSPRYPSTLESSRVAGEVVAQFVVDTTGRADISTLRILQSSNELFSAALESVIPRWRFQPAEAGGRKVKQIVQVPVRFVAPPGE